MQWTKIENFKSKDRKAVIICHDGDMYVGEFSKDTSIGPVFILDDNANLIYNEHIKYYLYLPKLIKE